MKWENTTNETVLQQARDEIWQSWRYTCAENSDHPRAKELFNRYKLPAFHDPFAGVGALPLEAQRLGLESYASDLNPVAVLICKAMVEIPPKFSGNPPVNPSWKKKQDDEKAMTHWKGARGLAEDVRYYGIWMRDEAEKRIGHLYPKIEVTAAMAQKRLDLKKYVGQKLTVIAWLWARTVSGPHYWYSTQPTVTKLAEDRAEQLKRDPDKVVAELEERLRKDLKSTGDFNRIHAMPQTGADVPDDLDARLVVLGVNHPYSKDGNSAAEIAAKAILETRGNTPRLYRNTLVFLAADKTRLQELGEAARKYLAWESILAEKQQLNLSPYQVTQAETQRTAADSAVTARLPETYQLLLVPVQNSTQAAISWEMLRLSGQDALAVRASKKLRSEELYLTSFAPTRLRMALDRVPLWRGDHVAVKQLVEDFARYLYLPRLRDSTVLLHAIRDGVSLLTWTQDSYGFADSFDEGAGRYKGLRGGQMVSLADAHAPGLVVKPDVATKQMDAERSAPIPGSAPAQPGREDIIPAHGKPGDTHPGNPQSVIAKPTRFHGSVTLDTARVGRDASKIADEVIAHLAGLVGATVTVTLEVAAEVRDGGAGSCCAHCDRK